eukprot:TRINITY_DN9902_c0_g1_i1.p1 TRINITY_DN9902_c0_g1~~TRINITY_DN9902_c0_g1_i1.p1  ORF type:complete len:74 (-),score=11.22 TRINITY_DN9902_c0_g1_i1:181-402(-)
MLSVYKVGPVGYTAIGATCVGSVLFTEDLTGSLKDGNDYSVKKGENVGWFEFGGSTVVLLFPKNSITIDDDLF